MESRPDTAIAALKMFWRSFVALWLFPPFFILLFALAEKVGHPVVIWWGVGAPLFFWSFARASRPWLQGRIRYWHQVLWAIVVPFTFWAAIAMLPHAVGLGEK